MLRVWLFAIVFAASSAASAGVSGEHAQLASNIKANTKGKVTPTSINKTPVPGIYEIVAGVDVFYTDATGRYAFVEGHMLDLANTKDLTQDRLEAVSRIDFDALPKELAIKTVRGNGKRTIAVFEDPNCSFCRAFRTLLGHLDDVTIYSFPYPVLSADSEAKVRATLCAKDKAKAWDKLMTTGQISSAPTCNANIRPLLELGNRLHVMGTPTVFFSNGTRSQGAVPPDQFMAMLAEVSR